MEKSLPYLVSPGSIKNALERIRQAATPDRVTGDFITTKLSIKGGTGAALLPFLKKIGLVNSDGSPTELYKQFRNPATGGAAIAAAIKAGYKDLGRIFLRSRRQGATEPDRPSYGSGGRQLRRKTYVLDFEDPQRIRKF